MNVAVAAAVFLSLADGETRQARTWPDGSFECPFCGSAVCSPEGWAEMEAANTELYARQGQTYQPRPYPERDRACWQARRCGNPACMTGLDAAGLAALREQITARQERAAAEQARHEAVMRSLAESREARDRAWDELSAKARAAGQCLACLRHSPWQYQPRLVRHRDPGNCPRKGRW